MDQPAGTELRLRVKSERVSFMLGVEQDSGNHCSITSHQLALSLPLSCAKARLWSRINFLRIRIQQFSECGSGSSCFKIADPDPA